MPARAPAPGEIYWIELADSGARPAVVVSRQSLNRGKYVVIVPCTTTKLEARRNHRNCVPFHEGEFGLTKDCVAQAEAIAQVRLVVLDTDAGPLGRLDDDAMRELVRAIGYVIESECERI